MTVFRKTPYLGTAFYVDAINGDDDNDGSWEHQWQTIAKVNAAALVPGNRVYFNPQAPHPGKLAPVTSGDVTHPIIYGTYGGGRAIIDGSADIALYNYNTAYYLRFEHIDFSGSAAADLKGTIQYWAHDAYFYDCIFRDSVLLNCYGAGFN